MTAQQSFSSPKPQQSGTSPDTTTAKSWATKNMSQCIAVVLALMSILGIIMASQSIQQVNWLRTVLTRADPSSTAAVDEAFNDPANAAIIRNLYVAMGANVAQFLISAVGFVAIGKCMVGMYKAYFGLTAVLAVVRGALMAIMSFRWYVAMMVVVNLLVLYPMYAYVPVIVEEAAENAKGNSGKPAEA